MGLILLSFARVFVSQEAAKSENCMIMVTVLPKFSTTQGAELPGIAAEHEGLSDRWAHAQQLSRTPDPSFMPASREVLWQKGSEVLPFPSLPPSPSSGRAWPGGSRSVLRERLRGFSASGEQ